MPSGEKAASLLVTPERSAEPVQTAQLREALESGNEEAKITALKRLIAMHVNGEPQPQLLMAVIRFVMPSRHHMLKKLVFLYLEVIERAGPDGKQIPEMLLVCNFLRQDLQHPNEYIRGAALRFITRLRETELLEPLLPALRLSLEHRHTYVRRTAALALFAIYRNFEQLVPDAPDLVANYLTTETDPSARRNGLLMLLHSAPEKAQTWLETVLEQVPSFPEQLQLLCLEAIRTLARLPTAASSRGRYTRCVFALLQVNAPAVQYEAASTLLTLSSTPTALKQAASAYIQLLCTQSDQNAKLVVLERLQSIRSHAPKVLQELLMDLLRALASPSLEIRRKTLAIALDLVTPRNVEEVIGALKKEIIKTQSREMERAADYRQALIEAIHQCAVRFPDVAASVVLVVMDFLGDPTTATAVDVAFFVRETVHNYPNARDDLLKKLAASLSLVRASKVFRTVLWVLSEYSTTPDQIDAAITAIKEQLGEPPFMPTIAGASANGAATASSGAATASSAAPAPSVPATVTSSRVILPDGTYATQSALTEVASAAAAAESAASASGSGGGASVTQQLRKLIEDGDALLMAALGAALTKLVLKTRPLAALSTTMKNALTVDALSMLAALLRLGSRFQPSLDADCRDRLELFVRVLAATRPTPALLSLLTKEGPEVLARMLEERRRETAAAAEKAKKKESAEGVQPDDLIRFRQLRANARAAGATDDDDAGLAEAITGLTSPATDLKLATGEATATQSVTAAATSALQRVHQLTGFSDPLYAEAVITSHQYDILLEVSVVNQTSDTLQNLQLELATQGDLRLVERPPPLTMGPFDRRSLRAAVKVSSTETGAIFGQLVYDVAGASSQDRNAVILADIRVDIMDYIVPASCSEAEFRQMWAEFEWENKVVVSTSLTDPQEYLQHLVKATNMRCLTPTAMVTAAAGGNNDKCDFLSANLYSKSIFGEDALANLSVEKLDDGRLTGFIRIRCKTQGIALSLGDKITMRQRGIRN